jgi:hypothetical protein
VGICLAFANQYPPMHVPQVPDVPDVPKDVPDVPKDVPDVPEVPEVPMVSEFVWQLPINIRMEPTGDKFFNKVLTIIFVYVI